jgi:hypothetical protein
MKAQQFLILFTYCLFGCKTQQIVQGNISKSIQGIYKQKESSIKMELKADGSYILYNPLVTFTPLVEQCEYASKGTWGKLSNDVLEITSENYYQQQKGFKYELQKDNKLSQDSLYIKINLPDSIVYYKSGNPVNFSFTFNDNVSKSISTNKNVIAISKQKHLGLKPIQRNIIDFSLNANVLGTTLYKGRILFKIFEEEIDTEKYNHLTVNLPNFDLCFFEFEPYKAELIFVKNDSQLIWQGKVWEKSR